MAHPRGFPFPHIPLLLEIQEEQNEVQMEQDAEQDEWRSVAFVRKLGVEAGIVGKYYCKRNLNTDFFHYLWLLPFQTTPHIFCEYMPAKLAHGLTHYPFGRSLCTDVNGISQLFLPILISGERSAGPKHLVLKVCPSKVFLRANAIGIN